MKKIILIFTLVNFYLSSFSQDQITKFKYIIESQNDNHISVIFTDSSKNNFVYYCYKMVKNVQMGWLRHYNFRENIDTEIQIYPISPNIQILESLDTNTIRIILKYYDPNTQITNNEIYTYDLTKRHLSDSKSLDIKKYFNVYHFAEGYIVNDSENLIVYDHAFKEIKKISYYTQKYDSENFRNSYPIILIDKYKYYFIFGDSINVNNKTYKIDNKEKLLLNKCVIFNTKNQVFANYNQNDSSFLYQIKFENLKIKINKIPTPSVRNLTYYDTKLIDDKKQIYEVKDSVLSIIKHEFSYWDYGTNYETENFGFKIGYSPFTGIGNYPLVYLIIKSDSSYYNISNYYGTKYYDNLKLNYFVKHNLIKPITAKSNKFLFQLKSLYYEGQSEFLLIDTGKVTVEIICYSILKQISTSEYLVIDNFSNFGVFNIENLEYNISINNPESTFNTISNSSIFQIDNSAKLYQTEKKLILAFHKSSISFNKIKNSDSLEFKVKTLYVNGPITYFDGKEVKEFKSDKEYSIIQKRKIGTNDFVFAGKVGNKLKFVNKKNQEEVYIFQDNGSNKSLFSIYYFDNNIIAILESSKIRIFQNQKQKNYSLNQYGNLIDIDYDLVTKTLLVVLKKSNNLLVVLNLNDSKITTKEIETATTGQEKFKLNGKFLLIYGFDDPGMNKTIDCFSERISIFPFSITNKDYLTHNWNHIAVFVQSNYTNYGKKIIFYNFSNNNFIEFYTSSIGNFEKIEYINNLVVFFFGDKFITKILDLEDFTIRNYSLNINYHNEAFFNCTDGLSTFFTNFNDKNPIFLKAPSSLNSSFSNVLIEGDKVYLIAHFNNSSDEVFAFENNVALFNKKVRSKEYLEDINNKTLDFFTKITPNPSEQYLNISTNGQIKNIKIFDSVGKIYGDINGFQDITDILNKSSINEHFEESLNQIFEKLNSGLYLIAVTYLNNTSETKRILKR